MGMEPRLRKTFLIISNANICTKREERRTLNWMSARETNVDHTNDDSKSFICVCIWLETAVGGSSRELTFVRNFDERHPQKFFSRSAIRGPRSTETNRACLTPSRKLFKSRKRWDTSEVSGSISLGTHQKETCIRHALIKIRDNKKTRVTSERDVPKIPKGSTMSIWLNGSGLIFHNDDLRSQPWFRANRGMIETNATFAIYPKRRMSSSSD